MSGYFSRISCARAESLVGLGRRHLDVDDRDVGFVRADLQEQIFGRTALADDLEALALEQACQALAQQHGVVGEDDPDRRLLLREIRVLAFDAMSVADQGRLRQTLPRARGSVRVGRRWPAPKARPSE